MHSFIYRVSLGFGNLALPMLPRRCADFGLIVEHEPPAELCLDSPLELRMDGSRHRKQYQIENIGISP
jgi:hypothetical protein